MTKLINQQTIFPVDKMDEGIKIIGSMMKISARTAPKAMGVDVLEIRFLNGVEKDILGKEMLALGKELEDSGYTRDGNNLEKAQACLLVGLKPHSGLGLNCGGCGFETCSAMNSAKKIKKDYQGPNCAIRVTDLGIAVSSAAKTAADHNVDNRIMYRVGTAAIRLGLLDCTMAYGIPLSATGKNIFFDR